MMMILRIVHDTVVGAVMGKVTRALPLPITLENDHSSGNKNLKKKLNKTHKILPYLNCNIRFIFHRLRGSVFGRCLRDRISGWKFLDDSRAEYTIQARLEDRQH